MSKTWDTFDKSMFGIKNNEGDNDLKIKKNIDILPRYSNSDLLGFQEFIYNVFKEVYRVLKPGGHALVWSIPRTSHHTAMGLERAGFEIRDKIIHIFSSGFPKSHNIGLGIDKINGHDNRGHAIASGNKIHPTTGLPRSPGELLEKYKGKSIEGKQYEGWGTALKPAHEDWILCRKPLSEDTVAKNVLKWGTGGLNIDATRIPYNMKPPQDRPLHGIGFEKPSAGRRTCNFDGGENKEGYWISNNIGRFPSNLIHDGSQPILDEFNKKGNVKGWSSQNHNSFNPYSGDSLSNSKTIRNGLHQGYNDDGSPSRFFYCSKPNKKEKNAGCEELELQSIKGQDKRNVPYKKRITPSHNNHPTVKSIELMEYLIKLITPKDGVVLDCFVGSGTTLCACEKLGIKYVGIEKEKDYITIAENRIKYWRKNSGYKDIKNNSIKKDKLNPLLEYK